MNMRHQHSGSTASSGRTGPWTALLVTAFVLGFFFPAGSTAIGDTATDSGSGSVAGGDDETIGTLPIVGNQGQLDLVRRLRDAKPDFYLEGSYGELLSTIVGFTGTGKVTLEDRPGGLVRLGFHGQVELALDRGLLQVTGIQIGANVPRAYRGARSRSGMAGQAGPVSLLGMGELDLPVTALDAIGALSPTPWILAAHSRAQGRYLFHAVADAGVLYIGQTY